MGLWRKSTIFFYESAINREFRVFSLCLEMGQLSTLFCETNASANFDEDNEMVDEERNFLFSHFVKNPM